MRFVKMHGLSNDYVFVDMDRETLLDPAACARRISLPHTGIGSDGLVLFGRDAEADFFMRIFNADGSEAEMCGNAARCMGKYLYERGYTKKEQVLLRTLSGVRRLFLSIDEGGRVPAVSVDMGAPALGPEAVGLSLAAEEPEAEIPLEVLGQSLGVTAVSMGNPHVVLLVPDVARADVPGLGAAIENHEAFAHRTNVEFVQAISPGHLRMRVFERGSGETQACGTGACAALVAAHLRGKAERRCRVELPGGELTVLWSETDGHVYKEGPANIVFEGEWLED